MGILDFFRSRHRAIRDRGTLGDFVDRNAAFIAQKGLYEYSRARAGHYAKVLFGEPGFREAIERSRWRAFPLGLGMVAEVVDSVLHDKAPSHRSGMLAAVSDIVLAVFDRYPAPAGIEAAEWADLRAGLARRLERIGVRAPKRAMDIPVPYAESYFELMPIHEKLRGRDYPTTQNYLMVTLCNIHDELSQGIDVDALTGALQQRSDA